MALCARTARTRSPDLAPRARPCLVRRLDRQTRSTHRRWCPRRRGGVPLWCGRRRPSPRLEAARSRQWRLLGPSHRTTSSHESSRTDSTAEDLRAAAARSPGARSGHGAGKRSVTAATAAGERASGQRTKRWRGPSSSCCRCARAAQPSAHRKPRGQIAPETWRDLLEPTREAARRLVATGHIEITQKGAWSIRPGPRTDPVTRSGKSKTLDPRRMFSRHAPRRGGKPAYQSGTPIVQAKGTPIAPSITDAGAGVGYLVLRQGVDNPTDILAPPSQEAESCPNP